ncbi:MAG TPA: DUF2339 domain-containing protein [Fontimonas sp.]
MHQAPSDVKPTIGFSLVLALGLGAVLAGWGMGFGGFVIGAAIGLLFGRVLHLQRRVDALARQLQQDRAIASAVSAQARREPPAAAAAPAADPTPAVSATPTPEARPAAMAPGQVFAQRVSAAPPAAGASGPSPTPAPSPQSSSPRTPPPYTEQAIGKALQWLKGGNPLARAGIVILFFGLAFLAKYAAENAVLPLELRFLMIAATALVLLVVGWRLRARRRLYAHLLQGGGVAALYLTVFAAARLYTLLPVGLALGLMVVIAVAAALLAVLQNSLPLAVIGTAGGFLAPLLVSTGSGNHIALFSYYAILNLGVFSVAWFRAWRVLNLIGFVFTFGVSSLFRATHYTLEDRLSTDAFLVLFFLMYVAISVLLSIRQKPDLKGYVSGTLVFGLPVAAFALHGSIVQDIPFALAWSALALGAFYLALAWLLFRRGGDSLRLLSEAFAALGVIFGSLAIPLAFDTQATSAMWAVEGAGLLWLGVRQQRLLARVFGLLLQLLAGLAFLADPPASLATAGVPLLNGGFLGIAMLAFAGACSALWLRRGEAQLRPSERGLSTALLLWSAAWWVCGSVAEIGRSWPLQATGTNLAFFAATITVLALLARRLVWPQLARLAFGLMLPAVALGLVQAAANDHPAAQGGGFGWLLLLALWMRTLWRIDRDGESEQWPLLRFAHASTLLLVVALLAWESCWQISQQLYGVWRFLPLGLIPAAALWVLGSAEPRPAWPVARHADAYRRDAAFVLTGLAAAWVLIINLSSDGSPVPLDYLPLLNPLDLSVAMVLLAAARHAVAMDLVQRLRAGDGAARQFAVVAAALVFIWMNAMLARALHDIIGIPLDGDAFARSATAQTAFSVFWGLIGFTAMVLSSRRHWRAGWIAGAALMAVVVAKLFLVDTADSGTLARVVSFITVGVLLLVIGYISPLPPPKKEVVAT